MAIAVSTVWETRASGASDNNGGAWAPLTVSTFSGTDLVVDASVATKVTSVTHNFVAADVGARIQISNPTPALTAVVWTPGFYTINSVAANAATLSSSPAAVSSTGGIWTMVGSDRSQQNAAQVVIDNSTITTSITASVITFTGYVPTVADVGNMVQMLTGTNVTAGFYQITAFTATTWTVSGAVALPTSGTTTNATGNMGGALATLGKVVVPLIGGNKVYCTGAFTSTATTSVTVSSNPTGAIPFTRVIGYGAARGDATHATLTLTGSTLTGLSASGVNGVSFEQMDVNCNSQTTSVGILVGGARSRVLNCLVSNFTSKGINGSGSFVEVHGCEVTGGTAAATAAIDVSAGSTGIGAARCYVHDNACPGIKVGVSTSAVFCLVTNNSGATSDGIQVSEATQVLNCTIHNSGRDGIRALGAAADNLLWRNNILSNNAGFGITGNTSTAMGADPDFDGNAFFSNTSGTRSAMDSFTGIYGVNPYTNSRDVTLTVSPYVGGTTGSTANFALNNTAGGGAACRAVGSPGTWAGNTGTTGYLDMGAVQTRGSNTSPSAGGSPGIIMATG